MKQFLKCSVISFINNGCTLPAQIVNQLKLFFCFISRNAIVVMMMKDLKVNEVTYRNRTFCLVNLFFGTRIQFDEIFYCFILTLRLSTNHNHFVFFFSLMGRFPFQRTVDLSTKCSPSKIILFYLFVFCLIFSSLSHTQTLSLSVNLSLLIFVHLIFVKTKSH